MFLIPSPPLRFASFPTRLSVISQSANGNLLREFVWKSVYFQHLSRIIPCCFLRRSDGCRAVRIIVLRVYELREELEVFLTNERSDYAKLLASDRYTASGKAGIPGRYFSSSEWTEHTNARPNWKPANIKWMHSAQRCNSGNNTWKMAILKYSHSPNNGNTAALREIIVKHLKTLGEKMPFYFYSASTECLDWRVERYWEIFEFKLAIMGKSCLYDRFERSENILEKY